jgi:hypothetical protein
MFCGECGRAVSAQSVSRDPDSGMPVVAEALPLPPEAPAPRPNDTVIVDSFDFGSLAEAPVPPIATERAQPAPVPHSEGIEQDLPADFDEPEVFPTPAVAALRLDPFPWGERSVAISVAPAGEEDFEQTLIVQGRDAGERFVLQFSTGESVTVSGSGLLGRNPTPQPGEFFDHLVSISDPGKSVSKTHLEFGQDAGAFWVSDRFSGNGSVVREPDLPPKRLGAGKRFRVSRGSRVDIGEQFFVVS